MRHVIVGIFVPLSVAACQTPTTDHSATPSGSTVAKGGAETPASENRVKPAGPLITSITRDDPERAKRGAAARLLAESVNLQTQRLVPSQLDRPLEILSIELPDYPAGAVRANTEGEVVVAFIVGVDGVVRNVVAQATDGALAEAARLSIGRWRFTPPMKDGKPIAIRITLPINFRLVDG